MTERQAERDVSFHWVSNIPCRTTNYGLRAGWYFPTEHEAKIDAIKTALKRENLDEDQVDILWRNLEKAGWRISDQKRP